MKFFRYFVAITLAMAMVASVSCNKDDDDSTDKEYLSGTMSFDFPTYLYYGDVVHVAPTGVYRGKDVNDTLLSYKWTNPFTGIIDTLRLEGEPASSSKEFDFTVSKDTLATFTISVTAWADGYYEKTTTATFTVVDPELGSGSLSGYDFVSSMPKFTDARDGKQYYYNTVGGKDWMIQNLAWNGAGLSFEFAEALDPIFGRFYTWTEASSACPAGWHLPSDAEFKALAEAGGSKEELAAGSLMVDASFNGTKLWEFWPEVKITNTSRFSAIPVGYATVEGSGAAFKGYGDYAMFWTSDALAGSLAIARYLYVDQPVVFRGEYGKESLRTSVRCIR